MHYKRWRTTGDAETPPYLSKLVHGHASRRGPSAEYRAWAKMIERCRDLADLNYGGRGIRVADAWLTFEVFLHDMGPRPSPAHSIDRIDVNGHYELGNVRWATAQEQQRNRTNNRRLHYQGVTKTVAEWAEDFGLSFRRLHNRIQKGWALDRALTQPVRRHG